MIKADTRMCRIYQIMSLMETVRKREMLRILQIGKGKCMEMKFYRCSRCGQIVAIVNDTGMPIICCGEVIMARS